MAQKKGKKIGPDQRRLGYLTGRGDPRSVSAARRRLIAAKYKSRKQLALDKILRKHKLGLGNASQFQCQPSLDAYGYSGCPKTSWICDIDGQIRFREGTNTARECEVRVFVEGAEVSSHLRGSINWSIESTGGMNTCSFTLNNAYDAFIITPQNVCAGAGAGAGPDITQWRVHDTSLGSWAKSRAGRPSHHVDETAKLTIYNNKLNRVNPNSTTADKPPQIDASGMWLYPLNPYSCVFNKHDCVRVFYRLPHTTGATGHNKQKKIEWRELWIPAFTGFIDRYDFEDHPTTGDRVINIQCYDYRGLLERMRVRIGGNPLPTDRNDTSSGTDTSNQSRIRALSRAKIVRDTKLGTVKVKDKTAMITTLQPAIELYTRWYNELTLLYQFENCYSKSKGNKNANCDVDPNISKLDLGCLQNQEQRAWKVVKKAFEEFFEYYLQAHNFVIEENKRDSAKRKLFVEGSTPPVVRMEQLTGDGVKTIDSVCKELIAWLESTGAVAIAWAIKLYQAGIDRIPGQRNPSSIFDFGDNEWNRQREFFVYRESFQSVFEEIAKAYPTNGAAYDVLAFVGDRALTKDRDPNLTKNPRAGAVQEDLDIVCDRSTEGVSPKRRNFYHTKWHQSGITKDQCGTTTYDPLVGDKNTTVYKYFNPTNPYAVLCRWINKEMASICNGLPPGPISDIDAAVEAKGFPKGSVTAQSYFPIQWGRGLSADASSQQRLRLIEALKDAQRAAKNPRNTNRRKYNSRVVDGSIRKANLRLDDANQELTRTTNAKNKILNSSQSMRRNAAVGDAMERGAAQLKFKPLTQQQLAMTWKSREKRRDGNLAGLFTTTAVFDAQNAGMYQDLIRAMDKNAHPLAGFSFMEAVKWLTLTSIPTFLGYEFGGDAAVTGDSPTEKETVGARNSLQNWNKLVLFGFLGRPMTTREVTLLGRKTVGEIDPKKGLLSPLQAFVHTLQPPNGTPIYTVLQTDVGANPGAAKTYQHATRLQLIRDICESLDYQFFVSPAGDLIFEYPHYNAFPSDFGSIFEGAYTVGKELKTSRITPETGPLNTAWVLTGQEIDARGQAVIGGQINQHIFQKMAFVSPMLARRIGVRVRDIQVKIPGVGAVLRGGAQQQEDTMKIYALFEIQREIGKMEKVNFDMAFRPYQVPNRPIHLPHRQRIGLVSKVSYGMPVPKGICTTNVDLQYVRWLFRDGTFRHIAGGSHMPIDYDALYTGDLGTRVRNVRWGSPLTDPSKERLLALQKELGGPASATGGGGADGLNATIRRLYGTRVPINSTKWSCGTFLKDRFLESAPFYSDEINNAFSVHATQASSPQSSPRPGAQRSIPAVGGTTRNTPGAAGTATRTTTSRSGTSQTTSTTTNTPSGSTTKTVKTTPAATQPRLARNGTLQRALGARTTTTPPTTGSKNSPIRLQGCGIEIANQNQNATQPRYDVRASFYNPYPYGNLGGRNFRRFNAWGFNRWDGDEYFKGSESGAPHLRYRLRKNLSLTRGAHQIGEWHGGVDIIAKKGTSVHTPVALNKITVSLTPIGRTKGYKHAKLKEEGVAAQGSPILISAFAVRGKDGKKIKKITTPPPPPGEENELAKVARYLNSKVEYLVDTVTLGVYQKLWNRGLKITKLARHGNAGLFLQGYCRVKPRPDASTQSANALLGEVPALLQFMHLDDIEKKSGSYFGFGADVAAADDVVGKVGTTGTREAHAHISMKILRPGSRGTQWNKWTNGAATYKEVLKANEEFLRTQMAMRITGGRPKEEAISAEWQSFFTQLYEKKGTKITTVDQAVNYLVGLSKQFQEATDPSSNSVWTNPFFFFRPEQFIHPKGWLGNEIRTWRDKNPTFYYRPGQVPVNRGEICGIASSREQAKAQVVYQTCLNGTRIVADPRKRKEAQAKCRVNLQKAESQIRAASMRRRDGLDTTTIRQDARVKQNMKQTGGSAAGAGSAGGSVASTT